MESKKETGLDFLIDKLTKSIENVVTGDSLPTEISMITTKDLKLVHKRKGWLFDWNAEFSLKERDIFKLTVVNNPTVIQGLISLEVKSDHVFVHLVENAPFNKGQNKMYMGVAGNLMAFACKISFQRGHEGNVAFISKSQLIDHYLKTLGAIHFGGRLMIIETKAVTKLINKYFHNG